MKTNPQKRRLALSPVISALILSASVLVVGGAVWGFSQGAMTISAEDYAAASINMSETISERFIVEHVAYNPEELTELTVWIYNYGKVAIEVKIKVEKNGETVIAFDDWPWTALSATDFKELDPFTFTASSSDTLTITATTRRGNSVYYTYIVP